MAIYAGIDGGGTKTICAIGDETRVLGTGHSGGSNVVRSGEARARESLQEALRNACSAAGVKCSDIHRACVGASGAGRAEQKELVRRAVAELISGEAIVLGDMETTMYAAFGEGAGIVTIAGTGSIAYGRDRAGTTARAGGWGFAVSDEGSGQWIGRTAVTAALRARDEQRPTQLLQQILNGWRLDDEEALVRVANGSPPPNFSEVVPLVEKAAEQKDEVANAVMAQAGAELARLARIVFERLFQQGDEAPLAMSGGVFRECRVVRDAFSRCIRETCPTASVREELVEPVEGALAMARSGPRDGSRC